VSILVQSRRQENVFEGIEYDTRAVMSKLEDGNGHARLICDSVSLDANDSTHCVDVDIDANGAITLELPREHDSENENETVEVCAG